MYREDLYAFIQEEMRPINQELNRLLASYEQMADLPKTTEELQPILQGIEHIIDDLQRLHDRCIARFPTAEADGTPNPNLEILRSQIKRTYILWEAWNLPIK